MNNKLTNKQNLFAKYYAMGKSGKDAAIIAGYSEHSAEEIASENLTKPEILKRIEAILNKAGLSDEALAARLQKAIDAGLGQRANNADAIKGIKMAYELKDRFPSSKQQIDINQDAELRIKLQSMTNEELQQNLNEITAKTQYYLNRLKESESAKEVSKSEIDSTSDITSAQTG